MLSRLFVWLCYRIASPHKDNEYRASSSGHGYIRYIGPIMVDWSRHTRKGQDRGIVKVYAETSLNGVNKASLLRRLFIWLCMVLAKRGDAWACSFDKNIDYSLRIGKATIGWGEFDDGFREKLAYGELHSSQCVSIRRKHKVQYIRKPFKGSCAYEWQVLGIVLSIFYPRSIFAPDRERWGISFFWDVYWSGNYTQSPLAKLVVWLSRKGEEEWDDDLREYVWTVGPLVVKSRYDTRLNFYEIHWGEKRLWNTAD